MEGIGRGWWAPPKGDHVGKLRLNAKGRALFNKGVNKEPWSITYPEGYYEYHGTYQSLRGETLELGGRQGGDFGGVFTTPDIEYAKRYAYGKDKGLYKVDLSGKKIFDLSSKEGIKKIESVIGQSYTDIDGDTQPFTKDDFEFLFPLIEGKRQGADWATFANYSGLFEKMDFDGVRIFERPGEVSTALFKGGVKVSKVEDKDIYTEVTPPSKEPGDHYSESTRNFYRTWADTYYGSQIKNLTKREENAISDFTKNLSLGSELRYEGESEYVTSTLREYKEHIDSLDSAIAKCFIPHNVKLFRGGNFAHYTKLRVGDSFIDKAFVSTSLERDMASDWGSSVKLRNYERKGVVFVINAKKEQNGLYIGNVPYNDMFNEDHNAQREMVLPRNCKFTVRKISKKKNHTEIEVDLIEQGGKK